MSHMKITIRASTLIWISLFVASCATSSGSLQELWNNYENEPYNKAYAIASNGIAGAASGQQSKDTAVHLARVECINSGGIDCKVVDINGQPPEIQTATANTTQQYEESTNPKQAEDDADEDIGFTIEEDDELTDQVFAELGLDTAENKVVATHTDSNASGLPFMLIYTEKENLRWDDFAALKKEEGERAISQLLSDQLIKNHIAVLGRNLVDVSDPIFIDDLRTLMWFVKYNEEDVGEVTQVYAKTFPSDSDHAFRSLTYVETSDWEMYKDDILSMIGIWAGAPDD
jgi:hypothetical protein